MLRSLHVNHIIIAGCDIGTPIAKLCFLYSSQSVDLKIFEVHIIWTESGLGIEMEEEPVSKGNKMVYSNIRFIKHRHNMNNNNQLTHKWAQSQTQTNTSRLSMFFKSCRIQDETSLDKCPKMNKSPMVSTLQNIFPKQGTPGLATQECWRNWEINKFRDWI